MKSLKYFFLLIWLAINLNAENSEIWNQFDMNNGYINLFDSNGENKDIPLNPTATKYLLFNNFNLDASHLSFAQDAYINPINTDAEMKALFSFKPWDQTTLSTPLTDYDLVVFPLGDVPINATANNVAPITKIRELIAAGKKILITGRSILSWAFNAQSQLATPEIQKFFRDTLGVNLIGKVPVSVTQGTMTTFMGYVNQGDYKDPAAYGARIESNIKFKTGVSQYEEPIAYYTHVEGFKSINPDKFSQTYHFNSYTSDTLLCTKTKIGNSKIVLWTVGFENFSTAGARYDAIMHNINWLMEGEAQPGANVEFASGNIKFGNVPIGQTSEQVLSFKSTGVQDLVVNDILIDWDDYGVYKIVEDLKFPFSVKNGEAFSINIKFTPKENIAYDAIIEVHSNAVNYPNKTLTISGSGGTGSGPIMTTDLPNNKLSFGQVVKGNKSIITFSIKNEGNLDLDLTKQSFSRNDSIAFIIDQGTQYPWTIKPNEMRVMKIRFVPPADNAIFYGQYDIENNGLGANPFSIYFEGEGVKTLGLEENSIFEFYPNPAKEFISIYSKEEINNLSIAVFDNNGKKVRTYESIINNNGLINLNINGLNAGVYYLNINNGFKTEFLPLIIVK